MNEEESIAELRRRTHQEAACAVPLIKALYAAGMIDGWRAVRSVGRDPDRSSSYSGPIFDGQEFTTRKRA